jgi:hypothetical protein
MVDRPKELPRQADCRLGASGEVSEVGSGLSPRDLTSILGKVGLAVRRQPAACPLLPAALRWERMQELPHFARTDLAMLGGLPARPTSLRHQLDIILSLNQLGPLSPQPGHKLDLRVVPFGVPFSTKQLTLPLRPAWNSSIGNHQSINFDTPPTNPLDRRSIIKTIAHHEGDVQGT